jgi:uracil-DNA glycosylase
MNDPRLNLLNEPHVRPLTMLIREIMHDSGQHVPNVDPSDGGAYARVLFLLETPGPKAVGSDFVSADNPDKSASNMRESLDVAQLPRKDVVLWNVVPYCLSTPEKNENATDRHVRDAVPNTLRFVKELKNLQIIVFCGTKAHYAIGRLLLCDRTGMLDRLKMLATWHTGSRAYNNAYKHDHIHDTFRHAKSLLVGN